MNAPRSERWPALARRWGPPALLVVGLAAFQHVRGFDFVTEDDRELIAGNPLVSAWGAASWQDRLLTVPYSYAIPVTVASFALDWQLGGGRPGVFHATNLALHLAATLLLLLLARRWLHPFAALCAAALFLLHPVQSEAVAFITQRKDLLATLLSLVALKLVLDARLAATSWRLWLAVGAVALAVLSKPSALLIGPGLVAIHALAPEAAPAAARDRRRFAPLVLLCAVPAALLLLNLHVHRLLPAALVEGASAPLLRLRLAASALEYYARALVMPVELTPKVPTPTDGVGLTAWLLLAFVSLGFALALAIAIRRRARGALALLVWSAAAYLPVSNLIPLRRHAADSLLYLLLPALALAAGCFVQRLAQRCGPRGRALLAVVVTLLLAASAVAAGRQAAVWRDQGTLSAYLYQRFPAQQEAVRLRVEHLAGSGQREQAQRVWQRYLTQAIAARPAAFAARHHLMRLLLERGEPRQALAVIEQTPAAQRTSSAFWEAQLEWAMRARDEPRALRAARELVRRDPRSPHRALLEQLEQARRAAGAR